MPAKRSAIKEEHFGILTDDGVALEAMLVRPAGLKDPEVRVVQAWIPKFPLTMSSLLPAARYEATALGTTPRTVHLVFDLRGSGESDGVPSPEGFAIDVQSAHEWAKERFGPQVVFRSLGFPDLGEADRLVAVPVRPGVLVEFYRYDPPDERLALVLYFSRYANFSRDDDAACRAIAEAGYTVYGGDMMRYLLPAAPLTDEALWEDGEALVNQMGRPIYLIARAFAAGPALLLAAGVPALSGVIVTGPAQEGLAPEHLFVQDYRALLLLEQRIKLMAPRPVVFLWNQAEAGRYSSAKLKEIYEAAEKPRLWGGVPRIDGAILLNALEWLERNQSG